ncbi:MAG: hypothetical protein RLZZ502_1905 [Pseudomonadota bacterium]|jgi:DNA polymerase-3 subunit delta
MQIRHGAFAALLNKAKTKPVYLFHGDEPVLAILAIDSLRARLQAEGYAEREVWQVDRSFVWDEALAQISTGSLFSTRRLIEIRFNSNKLAAGEGEAKFAQVLIQSTADTVFIISLPKLDKGQFMSAWFQYADEVGLSIECAPIDREHLGAWIKQGIIANGQTISDEAVNYLVEVSEGNLLASKQAIDALAGSGWHDLNLSLCEEAVSYAARYATAQLSEAFLAGDIARTITVLRGLRAEQGAVPRVVSQISIDVHVLARVVTLMHTKNQSVAEAVKASYVWGKRQAAIAIGLRQGISKNIPAWLKLLPEFDAAAKGLRPKMDVWDGLERFVLIGKGA